MDDTPAPRRIRIIPLLTVVLLLVFVLWIFQQGSLAGGDRPATATQPAPGATGTRPPEPAASTTAAVGESLPVLVHDVPAGLLVLSLVENTRAHLFIYHPEQLPLTRITSGDWDDISPAVSPDGSRIAFSSNRGGSWDLYILDLADGTVEQVTDTPEYDGSPTWSPDGLFLAYESLLDEGLDILVGSADGSTDPIRLTDDPGADHSPAWSPEGRQIAFISTRTGEPEVWLADLQNTAERFTNLSANPQGRESHPAWSPGGGSLAWASIEAGLHTLYIAPAGSAGRPVPAGSGDWPVFSPDDATLLAVLDAPQRQFLAAYPAGSPDLLSLPPLALPGRVRGIDWADIRIPDPLPASLQTASEATPAPLWAAATSIAPTGVANRSLLVDIGDVDAPDPRLLDEVDESFNALRARSAARLGWDLLAALENAYVSISSPLPPGLFNDWLYTGRAFSLSNAAIQAGWILLVREDYGVQSGPHRIRRDQSLV
jgi:TolB protein